MDVNPKRDVYANPSLSGGRESEMSSCGVRQIPKLIFRRPEDPCRTHLPAARGSQASPPGGWQIPKRNRRGARGTQDLLPQRHGDRKTHLPAARRLQNSQARKSPKTYFRCVQNFAAAADSEHLGQCRLHRNHFGSKCSEFCCRGRF